MNKKIVLSLFCAALVYGADVPAPAPESAGIQMQKLEEIDKNVGKKREKATIEDLEVDEKIKGKAENRIKGAGFILQNVSVVGNTIQDKKKIIAIVKKYVGKKIDSVDLKMIAQELTELYTKNGYLTSKCIIPAQKVVNGNVKFQIIENKLGRIVLRGDAAYNYDTNLFMRYLHKLQGKIINVEELNEKLKILSTLPVTKITPRLQKADQTYTNLVLEITDKKEQFSLTIDNSGSKYTGQNRITLNGNINNIRGKSDQLALSLTTVPNPKHLTSFSSSYITPFGEKGGRVIFGYSHMYYQLDPEEVGTSDVIYEGQTDILSFKYAQPLYLLNNTNLSYNYGFEKKSVLSQTIQNQDVNNTGAVLIDGLDETFVLEAGVDISKQDNFFGEKYRGINSASLSVKKALEGFWNSMTKEDIRNKENDVSYPISGPIKYGNGLNPSFIKYYYDLSRQQMLPWDVVMTLRLNGNYTKDRVPDSYEYSGGDFGYGYSVKFNKKFYNVNASLSASKSLVYTYRIADMTIAEDDNKPSIGLGLNTTYEDFYFSLSYSSSLDTWDSNTNNLRYLLKYSW